MPRNSIPYASLLTSPNKTQPTLQTPPNPTKISNQTPPPYPVKIAASSETTSPATAALVSVARTPETNALKASLLTSPLREGAICERMPIWMPSELMLPKPQMA